jgi:hypothetical protein
MAVSPYRRHLIRNILVQMLVDTRTPELMDPLSLEQAENSKPYTRTWRYTLRTASGKPEREIFFAFAESKPVQSIIEIQAPYLGYETIATKLKTPVYACKKAGHRIAGTHV